MAFNAYLEDYQRLSLRFIRTLTGGQDERMRAFATFGHRFAHDRDSLPQSDADQAFHLVAETTLLLDYQLPFATEEEFDTIVSRARHLLEEAVSLDPHCHDAWRMLQASDTPGFDTSYDFLCETEPEVREHCEKAARAARDDESAERAELGVRLAWRPYVRWLASMASKGVVCGHNRAALEHVRRLLETDPRDEADARFTAAIALAKLEDEQGLEQLARRTRGLGRRGGTDAWMRLARTSLAHKRRDFSEAREQLRHIVRAYPHAAVALARQHELPEGLFARQAAPPFSEDELIIALSEGAVILQEGRDDLGMGVLGAWVAREALDLATNEQLGELQDLLDLRKGQGDA